MYNYTFIYNSTFYTILNSTNTFVLNYTFVFKYTSVYMFLAVGQLLQQEAILLF